VVTTRVAQVLVVVTILLAACTRSSPVSHSSPTAPPTPGQIAWTDCGSGFQCATLQVPLDYSQPEGRKISLALIRKPVTDSSARIGSLLINPGGPGVSAVQFLRDDVGALGNLNLHFDLVAFDPRGVGASSPVTCVSASQLDAYMSLDGVLDDAQEKAAGIQADKDFAAGCEQMSGDLLPFMDTSNDARDMDLIRDALGEAKLTYLGFSYGTLIGEWYAHLFPTHVRALSLDGIVDPAMPAIQDSLSQVVGFQQNLDAFIADCKARTSCSYGRSGDPMTKLAALMTRLDTTPMNVGSRQLTRSLAMTGVLQMMYDQTLWPYLDQSLTATDNNDGRQLLFWADYYDHRKADGTFDNIWNGGFDSKYCLDFPVPQDLAAYDALGPSFEQASPLFGPWSQYSDYQCALWPIKPKRAQGPLTATGAPPILLVGGTNDPATPYANAQSVNRQIAGSVLLTRAGNGHTSYGSSACSQAAEDAYLIDLTLPAAGTVCTS